MFRFMRSNLLEFTFSCNQFLSLLGRYCECFQCFLHFFILSASANNIKMTNRRVTFRPLFVSSSIVYDPIGFVCFIAISVLLRISALISS